MYPQVVILGVAAWRRDATVRWYSLPLVLIGLGISVYHYLLERFPDSVKFSCEAENPCSTVWVWKFHFLSIPAMAGIGFALIAVLVLLSAPAVRPGTDRPVTDDSSPDAASSTTTGPSNPEPTT